MAEVVRLGDRLPATAPDPGRRLPQDPGDPRAARRLVWIGYALLALFFFGAMGWAALATVSKAALAPGVVTVAGKRKPVQHLEGGIVERVEVREGDRVRAGDPLVRLQDRPARAELRSLLLEAHALDLRERRLVAERDGLARPDFGGLSPPAGEEAAAGEAARVEEALFGRQRELYRRQLAGLDEREAQIRARLAELDAGTAAREAQLASLREQIRLLRPMVARGVVARARLFSLEGAEKELLAGLAGLAASKAGAREQLAAVGVERARMEAARLESIVAELAAVREARNRLEARIVAARDRLDRSLVRAPVEGRVFGLAVTGPGAVVRPGEPLLEIVPTGDELIAEVRLPSSDRDVVQPGQRAEVRFLAFNQRAARPVPAVVETVAADRSVDPRTGQSFFLVRLRFLGDPAAVLGGHRIHPGMQVLATVTAGERTVLRYLLEPILRNLVGVFRES